MKTYHLCALVAALLLFSGANAAKEQHSSGTLTINPAEEAMKNCREAAKTSFDHVRCFEIGFKADPANYTWSASLALAYLHVELIDQAKQVMNHSATAWLKAHADKGLFENETLPNGQINITHLNALRRVYDWSEENNDNTTKDATVDMAFMLTKYFEVTHQVAEAHAIYYGFMQQLGVGSRNLLDFHRRTGNVIAMLYSGSNDDLSTAFALSEAYLPILDGITEHLMSNRNLPDGRLETPLKRFCGIEIDHVDEVKVQDVFDHITRCISSWGNFSAKLKEEEESGINHLTNFSALRYSPAHRLAQVGAWDVLKEFLNYIDGKTVPGDRFGRGSLHYAAAAGQFETLKGLVAFGGRVDKEDRGKVEPRHLGCSSPLFTEAMEEIIGEEDACDGITRERFEDDVEPADDSGNDAEWNPGAKRPKYLHCDIDVRDAASVTTTDLLLGYIHSNNPVVLRNAFYDTDGPSTDWRAKKFKKLFGDVLMRQETAYQGERYGIGPANVTTIKDFMDNLKEEDGTVADIVIDAEDHPLARVGTWVPPTFKNKKYDNEIKTLDAGAAPTTFIINKKGSSSNHRAAANSRFHAVVYGQSDVSMLPPRFAKTTRGKLTEEHDKNRRLRCSLLTGDVLVLPELWSFDYTSNRNGVALERVVIVPPRSERMK